MRVNISPGRGSPSSRRSRTRAIPLLIPLATLFGTGTSVLQAQTPPHLDGVLEVDVAEGRLHGAFCLGGLAVSGESARFALHRGLNVKHVKSAEGHALPISTEPEPHGNAVFYEVDLRTAGAQLASDRAPTVCAEYVGTFPVYDVRQGDYRQLDNTGVVAFNGFSLRALGATRWYPTPVSASTAHPVPDVTFRVAIRCQDCPQIYISGARPQPGPEAVFSSESPLPISIFAGDFLVQEADGFLFLGDELSHADGRLIARELTGIQDFFAGFLDLPYGPNPDIIRFIPVREDRVGQLWGFFSDPLIGLVGLPLAVFATILSDPDDPARRVLHGFLAHELAHRYFPGPLGGPHRQMFGEPFANYVDLKSTRHFFGEAAYRERLSALRDDVIAGPDMPRLDEADTETLWNDHYRYKYVPMLLFALEREIGEGQMQRVLRELLTSDPVDRAHADYAFFRRAAQRAGVAADVFSHWELDCMRPAVSENRCLRTLFSEDQ
jgi:hypothetical protein